MPKMVVIGFQSPILIAICVNLIQACQEKKDKATKLAAEKAQEKKDKATKLAAEKADRGTSRKLKLEMVDKETGLTTFSYSCTSNK
jgi:hypothetical protein